MGMVRGTGVQAYEMLKKLQVKCFFIHTIQTVHCIFLSIVIEWRQLSASHRNVVFDMNLM